jgi:RNA polymerase sigma-70 factor (ECF subfamily)
MGITPTELGGSDGSSSLKHMNWRRTSRSETTGDRELFARFLEGDDLAFTLFLERHNRRLYAFCIKMLRDPEAAQDVMQEVWERVIRLRGSGESVGNPLGLLMRIVRNLSLNHLRDERDHLSLDELAEAQHPGASAHEPSYLEELIVLALERLPMPQREVLILHTYSGYNYMEIASMLDLSVDNVRMRAMRGRGHLGRIMSALMAVEEERMQQQSTRSDEAERTPTGPSGRAKR